MSTASDDPYLGRTIAGKYSVEAQLGIGSVGTVYRATHQQLGRSVALKILRASLAKEPEVVARFIREAQLASRVEHPNVVRVYDCGTEPDGLTYLAMELLEGVELATLIERGPLPSERIVGFLSQVLSALAAAHKIGIVHRDLKPENILVQSVESDDGRPIERVKVADFGVARVYGEGVSQQEQITRFGMVSGTPEYMSPEQAAADELDGRSDLYACGVILYEMLAGRVPFTGDVPVEVLEQHIHKPVPPPWTWRSVDMRLANVALRAMAKSRDERFADAAAMRAALVAALAEPIETRGPEPAETAPENPSSVLVSVESEPSGAIDSAPSVVISVGDEPSVMLESAPSVVIESAPSVVIQTGPSEVIGSAPTVLASQSESRPKTEPTKGRRRSRVVVMGIVAGCLVAGAATAYWHVNRQSPTLAPAPVQRMGNDAGAPEAAAMNSVPPPAPRPAPNRPVRRPPRTPRSHVPTR